VNVTLYVTLAFTGAHRPTGNLLLPNDDTLGRPTHWATASDKGKRDKVSNVKDNICLIPNDLLMVEEGVYQIPSTKNDSA
jgi:hypothetical protein